MSGPSNGVNAKTMFISILRGVGTHLHCGLGMGVGLTPICGGGGGGGHSPPVYILFWRRALIKASEGIQRLTSVVFSITIIAFSKQNNRIPKPF